MCPATVSTVVLDRHARPERRLPEARAPDEPHDPLPVTAVRLEQLEHPVVVDRTARQRPPDEGRHVVVAHARSIRVPVRPLGRLGGGPPADTGHRLQPVGHHRATTAERQGALEGRRDPHRAHHGGRTPGLDAGTVPLPARDRRPPGRGRLHPHVGRGRTGRGRPEAPQEVPPRAPRLPRGHFLLHDRRHEGRDHRVRPEQAQAWLPVPGVDEERVRGHVEVGPVVTAAEHLGGVRHRPLGAVAPRRDGDRVGSGPADEHRRRPRGRPEREPGVRTDHTEGGVTGTALQGTERRADVHRPGGSVDRVDPSGCVVDATDGGGGHSEGHPRMVMRNHRQS